MKPVQHKLLELKRTWSKFPFYRLATVSTNQCLSCNYCRKKSFQQNLFELGSKFLNSVVKASRLLSFKISDYGFKILRLTLDKGSYLKLKVLSCGHIVCGTSRAMWRTTRCNLEHSNYIFAVGNKFRFIKIAYEILCLYKINFFFENRLCWFQFIYWYPLGLVGAMIIVDTWPL